VPVLSPDERSVLLDALRPPPGAVLDAAVGTTFTVDLATALVPPLAFARVELSRTDDPLAALQAVRQCSDRLDVFHQAGQIAVPVQASRLMAYLEPMLHGVRRPTPGHLFHPKAWFLRYLDPDTGQEHHRLLCLTRNLTQDRSWDVAVRLDGQRQGRPIAGNRPLADLLRRLPGRAVNPLPAERVARIERLADDARRIIWDLPPDAEEIYFHLLTGARSAVPDFSGRRHLVISPFLTDDGLQIVAPSQTVTVVSRSESFDALDPAVAAALDRRVLISMPAPAADEEAPADVAPDEGRQLVPFGLHAKVVVVERRDEAGHKAHVFLGSANATGPAFAGNLEFVVEIVGSRPRLGVEAMLGADNGLAAYLEEYPGTGGQPPDPDDDTRKRLERVLRDLAEAEWHAHVTASGDAWGIAVSTARPLRLPDDVRATVEVLTSPGMARPLRWEATDHGSVDGLPLADITPFLAVRAEISGLGVATVVRAELHGDPADRLDTVLASQVDTPDKFLRFLTLLLGLEDAFGPAGAPAGQDGAAVDFGAVGPGGGVLEAVLRALADNPRAILDLDRLVAGLARTQQGRDVLPAGFADLWRTVMAAHDRMSVSQVPS
jgi:hypothetical protein